MKDFEALNDKMLENVVGGLTHEESSKHYLEILNDLKKEHNIHIEKGWSLDSYKRAMTIYVNNAFNNGYINDFHYASLQEWVKAFAWETDYVY